MTGTLESLFAWLDAEVGVAEVNHQNVVILRDGTNLWRDYFGYQPPPDQAAWCALFQSVADWLNGTPIPPIQFSKGFVGVDAGRAWFAQHGLLAPAPKPGYLAFYNEHVGRVRRVTGPTTFDAIEGNEGDAVRVIHRSTSEIVGGFGVREYTSVPVSVEEEDMPSGYAPAGGQVILSVIPGRKGAVVVSSDQHPTNGANIRLAIGSDRAGGVGVARWAGGSFWVPPHRVGTEIPPWAEVVNVENAGPNGVAVSVEYA